MVLWGYKTIALFDVWSIEHFFTGMNLFFLSLNLHRWFRQPFDNARWFSIFGWIFALCYLWETLEHYLETGLWGDAVTYWFQGVEFWANRLITDPLLILWGSYLGYKHRWLNMPSKVFGVAWLVVHIFVFPDSMYLQRLSWFGGHG